MDKTAAATAYTAELSAIEAHVDEMIDALKTTQASSLSPPATENKQKLVHASRQTIGSLRACVNSIAGSPQLQTASAEAVQATAMTLSAIAEQLQKRPALEQATAVEPTTHAEQAISYALKTAASLAEQLRIFARVSQQSWAAARSQLSHAPQVPSPLASGSTPRHRRWASEDIESELAEKTPRLLADTAQQQHVRNRSDSRLQISPGTSPRPKQVRFLTRSPTIDAAPTIDQAHLSDLAQALSAFEKAIAALSSTQSEPGAQSIRGLATAFVQLSRLASSTGMVRHFDRQTLALFKTTTQAVKQIMQKS
ncbi:hypothetical protein LPJ64_002067 [Coemansia asiatica]|uniref:Uncharacterized protein n=1 Tax=Coemansia asiatica TaxID=1052880 RepID=A0A9W8CK21_9FUNG|nr:hypothetical protein LPJ64_002067 [Coemansia asiatica]KAJ2887368.1 hypothetical protein FB639_001371 [Coemansia asiatica]